MGVIARALGIKSAGVPSTSWDGTFSTRELGWGLGSWGSKTLAGTTVSTDSALGIVAVYACVRVLAESVASLPLIVYRRLPDGGKERATDHPLYDTLHDTPNPDMTSFVWRETLMNHVATWGNHYSEKVYDAGGRLQLWPIPPNRIEVKFEGGRRVYDFLTQAGIRQRLPDGSLFHVPGLSSNGLQGMSPIQVHREALGLYQALQDFGASTMRNNARPAVILTHPKTLSKGAIERLATQMDELRGSGNAGKTVVMEEGLTAMQVGIPPEDAQYIESRKFQLREVARMYRMQPHMIGDLDNATYTNIEHQSIDFVVHTLTPWLVRIEQEISTQLLYGEPDYFAEFLVDGLMRGDAETRAKSLMVQRQAGVITREEWRAKENMNPLDKPDDVWIPIANYTVATVDDQTLESGETPYIAASEQEGPPQLTVIKSAAVRCQSCNRKLADISTPPYRMTCPRCKAVTEAGSPLKSADDPEAVTGLRAAIQSLAEPPVVNIPAPIVNISPPEVTVDTESFVEALDDLRSAVLEMNKPRRRNLVRDEDGRLIAVEQ